jgi:hypothetical protein
VLLPHGQLVIEEVIRNRLLAVSPATIDRLLSEVRLVARGGRHPQFRTAGLKPPPPKSSRSPPKVARQETMRCSGPVRCRMCTTAPATGRGSREPKAYRHGLTNGRWRGAGFPQWAGCRDRGRRDGRVRRRAEEA